MADRGPLDGTVVVEMTVHRAGPYCGALLSDLGAEVIKIERPSVGDPSRNQGPGPEDMSGYFIANNRNKRSVTVDLKSEAGKDAALALLKEADVFVENFGYGVADRLGLGYDDVAGVNEDIIYASIKGYGETGPMKEKRGLDLILQAEGGIMSVTGPEDGEPVKVGQAIGDLTAGMYATIGVLALLQEQDTQDEAISDKKFDVGLFDAIVSVMNEYPTLYSMTGEVPSLQGTSHQTIVPYQLFETADSNLVVGVPSDERWDDFVDVIGREELRHYRTNEERRKNEDFVVEAIQKVFAERSTNFWLETLTEHGFPCGPLNDIADIVDHDQTQARDLLHTEEDPEWGEYLVPGNPLNFVDRDIGPERSAPRLGEHTMEVFEELDQSQTRLDEWIKDNAFGE